MTDAARRFLIRLSVDGAQQVRGELAQLGEQGDRAFQRIVSGAQGASRALSLLGPAISALSVGALANFVRRAVDAVGGLGELADQVGVSTDALQAYRFAATEVGLRNEDLDRGLAALTRRIADAATSGGEAETAFRRIGVAFLDASGNARATEGVLADIADRIAGIENPAERARIATEIFGDRLGQRLIPFLAGGREGLERLTAEALRFGQIADADLIVAADRASDRIAKLNETFGRLATNLFARVAPALEAAAANIERVAFGPTLAQRRAEIEQQIAVIEQFERDLRITPEVMRALGGGIQTTPTRQRIAELRQELAQLEQESSRFQERAREIVEGRTRAGGGEAELRRQRAAEDIAGLRETFDQRLRIEREYQERLDRIRRAAEAGAVAPEERQRLETDALRARDEALTRLTRTTTTAVGAEERRIDALRRQVELAGLVDERERFVAERVAGVSGVQRAEAERLANALFELQEARRAENSALQEAGRLYEETRTPLEHYVAALERLGELRPVLESRFGATEADAIIGRRAQSLLDELNRAEQAVGQVDDVARQLGLTFESAFEGAIVRGRSFSDVLKGIEQDLLRLGTRKLVTEPLLALFNSALGGIGGGGGIGGIVSGLGSFLAGLFHEGGEVGRAAVPRRRVPALAFAGAPRLHNGWFRPDEFPAILQRGEVVVPKRDAQRGFGPANVVINITTPDAESFRASQGQIAAAMARSLQRAQRSL
ncbi:phage tail tape measure protein [Elioraea sp.]|jgi:hypothetical protein|uniref:phage tail tape measure protein n=1 Tax=Elioraea sp. TaxID=2185103 RepID=UPI0021DD3453|nr:phage tail tape measure protein [Elioraea sp.]GIX11604.1 MAG: hypothetical protein KatS3mg116_3314 [Elioraea sp.]